MPLQNDIAGGRSTASRVIATLAAFVIVVAGMRASDQILVPFFLAVFVAIICSPVLHWLTHKRVPTSLAIVIVIAGLVAIGMLLVVAVGSSLDEFTRQLPLYESRLRAKTGVLVDWVHSSFGIGISRNEILKFIDPGAAMKLAGKLVNGLGGVLTNAFLIFLTVVFILMEAASFPLKLQSIMSDPEQSLLRLTQFTENVQHYLAIKTLASLATGGVIAAWLAFLGVDFPILWGLLAFFLNYVPNIGSIIAAVPAVLLAWLELNTGTALWAAAGYVLANGVIGNLIEPRFAGRSLNLSPLVVFISLVFWGWVLGPVGMFLSVPLTMMARIATEGDKRSRWIAVLLSSGAPKRDITITKSS
jgi:predicted PurR-regulated permease PerM